MNVGRWLLAMAAGAVVVVVSDMAIHGVWLADRYQQTAALWRGESEMMARFPWMTGAQVLAGITFVSIWVLGAARGATLLRALIYGLLMGLFSQAHTLSMYVVLPLPDDLAVKWFVSGMAQTLVLSVITWAIYRPIAPAA